MSNPRAQKRGSRTEPRPPPASPSGAEKGLETGSDPSPRPAQRAVSARPAPSGPLAEALALRSRGDVRLARPLLDEIAARGGPDADLAREAGRGLALDPGALLGAGAVGAVIALATWAGILLRR